MLANSPPGRSHLVNYGFLLFRLDKLDASGLPTNCCKEDYSDESADREDCQGRCIIWRFDGSKTLRQKRFNEDGLSVRLGLS